MGRTKSTTYSTFTLVEREGPELTIGRPVSNTQVYILDSYLHPVPIGIVGELYIGGDGLSRGYLNRPELTAERFIPNPFSQKSNTRLYKTGDLARYRLDGNIELLGRIDNQVKICGFRIELGEIEGVLKQHPEVREAVVARDGNSDNKRLVAFIVATHRRPSVISNLRDYLKEKLPEYMLPSAFRLLDAMPLMSNGKVDRSALLALHTFKHSGEEAFVAPTSIVHFQLVQIWEELLDARPIGIRDNFFHIGGYSLLAAQLVNRIEQVFGEKISLATLFARPTIEQLASAVGQH